MWCSVPPSAARPLPYASLLFSCSQVSGETGEQSVGSAPTLQVSKKIELNCISRWF